MTRDEAQAVIRQTLFDNGMNMTHEALARALTDANMTTEEAAPALWFLLQEGQVVERGDVLCLNI